MILKLLITGGNITPIPKEAAEEKENYMTENKENLKERNLEKYQLEMTNTTTTRGSSRKISMIFPFVSCSGCASNNSSC